MTEFETILLKSLIVNNEFFGKSMPILESTHFMNTGNQELFKLIKEYYGNYKSIPSNAELVSMVKNVSNSEIRKEIIDALKQVSNTEVINNVKFLLDETVKFVKDAMYLEALRIGSDGLMKKDDELKKKAQKIMDEMVKVSIDSDLGLDFDDIESMIEYYSERMLGIKTRHKELNKRLGPGFLPGTLSVILAASGIGKSLLMTDLISGMIQEGKNCLLVSLEMHDKEIMKRVHANTLDLPINNLTDLSKTSGELKRISNERDFITKDMIQNAYNNIKASGNCGKLFIKDYPSGSFSALMLDSLVQKFKIEKNIEFDIIFVDYLGIMKSDLLTPSAGLYSYLKSIAEEVRAFATNSKIPVISASQLNRGSYREVEKADNSNVSDSIGTVMTADYMLFLLQDEEMKEKKEIICKVTKNRFNGRTDTWLMNIDYDKMRFSDAPKQGNGEDINLELSDALGTNTGESLDDFTSTPTTPITAEKQKAIEEYAEKEVKNIQREGIQQIIEHDKGKTDPFDDDLERLYNELDI